MDKTICYCFNHSEQEIKNDVYTNNGHSTIFEQVLAAQRQGKCQCATNHPEHR